MVLRVLVLGLGFLSNLGGYNGCRLLVIESQQLFNLFLVFGSKQDILEELDHLAFGENEELLDELNGLRQRFNFSLFEGINVVVEVGKDPLKLKTVELHGFFDDQVFVLYQNKLVFLLDLQLDQVAEDLQERVDEEEERELDGEQLLLLNKLEVVELLLDLDDLLVLGVLLEEVVEPGHVELVLHSKLHFVQVGS